ncbi:MAG: hypothetical protein D6711_01490 [Chloroflexi bacterium]|nr:MAG: hypothetical protein D6711_01490 [Chloroflexota bacterium]
MPQLFSRTDDMKWLTPTMADILDQGAVSPGGDGTIREQMLWLQQKFSELGTPIRVVNVRPTPSYTLFILKPDSIGRLGNKQTPSPNDIKRSLGQIAEERRDWKFGFLPVVHETPDTLGFLLKTQAHTSLTARRLMIRNSYRDHPSRLAVIMGNTLEQRLIIYDIAEIGNLAIIGEDRTQFIKNILTTLLMLNTPAEMRIGLLGNDSYAKISQIPHMLGRIITSPDEGIRLLSSLQKELTRRRDLFANHGVADIDRYNEADQSSIPRIMLLIDVFSTLEWQQVRTNWAPILQDLLRDNGKAGIHLLIGIEALEHLPSELHDLLPTRVFMRNAARNLIDQVRNFHGSLMRFIDAILVSGSEIDPPIPVEGYEITETEVNNIVAYWQKASKNRQRESKISGQTGVTKMLTDTSSDIREDQTDITAQQAQGETLILNASGLILNRAQALASYLGWIGMGPLQDVLGLSAEESKQIINTLKQKGIIENVDSPTPRFIKLSN